MFSFSSLIGNYYYGEINISHLTEKKFYLHLFRIGVIIMTFVGSIASLDLVWNLAGFIHGLLSINLILVPSYVWDVLQVLLLDDYIKQRKEV